MIQQISASTPAGTGVFARGWAWLAALWQRSEPIDVVEQRFNFLPDRFRWRGDTRRVRAVTRVWERPSDGGPGAARLEVGVGAIKALCCFKMCGWHLAHEHVGVVVCTWAGRRHPKGRR